MNEATVLPEGFTQFVRDGAERRDRRRMSLILAAAVAISIAGVALAHFSGPHSRASAPSSAPPAVPVEAAIARRADVPIYASGLGTVQAFNTVTVRVRVDGELQKVNFVEGQDVKAGDLLAEIDPRPFQAALDQAIGKKNSDQAQLINARRDLERFTTLAKNQDVSRQQLDTQRALVAQLEASISGDDAAIESARLQLGYTRITAPLAGRVGIRLVDAGNMVHPTDTNGLVVITQMQPISVVFTLPDDQLPAVTKAMEAGTVAATALARDQKDVLGEGSVAVIDNQIDQATGTIRLKATFPNADKRLWPGQFVVLRVRLSTAQAVVTVPNVAIQRGAQGQYVYVVKPDDSVELRWVKVGDMNGDTAVIESGVAVGERVVTAGHYRLQPGTKVSVRT